jgi:hypothetical protein
MSIPMRCTITFPSSSIDCSSYTDSFVRIPSLLTHHASHVADASFHFVCRAPGAWVIAIDIQFYLAMGADEEIEHLPHVRFAGAKGNAGSAGDGVFQVN